MAKPFRAIEQFEKFSPSEKQRAAIKFFGSYDGPNRAFVDDKDNFEFEDNTLSEDGLEDWIDFLEGDDPFYFSDPPQSVQQEVMKKFDDFLYNEFKEFGALKKGYEKPIALLTGRQVIKVRRSLRKYRDMAEGILNEVVPAIEKMVKEELVSYTPEGEQINEQNIQHDIRFAPKNDLRAAGAHAGPIKLNIFSRALHGVIKNTEEASAEIKYYWHATMDAKETKDQGAKRRAHSHFEQYVREMTQMNKRFMVIRKQIQKYKKIMPEKIKEKIADGKIGEEEMQAFTGAVDWLSNELPNFIPVYGSLKMYNPDEPWDSEQNLASYGNLVLDSVLLWAAIATALSLCPQCSPPVLVAWTTAQYVAEETFLGPIISSAATSAIENFADYKWPELDRLDRIEQRGFQK